MTELNSVKSSPELFFCLHECCELFLRGVRDETVPKTAMSRSIAPSPVSDRTNPITPGTIIASRGTLREAVTDRLTPRPALRHPSSRSSSNEEELCTRSSSRIVCAVPHAPYVGHSSRAFPPDARTGSVGALCRRNLAGQ